MNWWLNNCLCVSLVSGDQNVFLNSVERVLCWQDFLFFMENIPLFLKFWLKRFCSLINLGSNDNPLSHGLEDLLSNNFGLSYNSFSYDPGFSGVSLCDNFGLNFDVFCHNICRIYINIRKLDILVSWYIQSGLFGRYECS